MTSTSILLIVACGLALCDWIAVGTNNRRAEFFFKPATMVPLIIAAATANSTVSNMGIWFTVALVCSLAGDVFLMLPDEEKFFVPGLGSFLVGHIAYVVGLLVGGVSAVTLVVGVVGVVILIALVSPRIVAGAISRDRRLGTPVLAYMLIISTMVACAIGSGVPLAILGALLFYASDFAIGWSRFVTDFRGARLFIMVTYHSAQVLLVASLLSGH